MQPSRSALRPLLVAIVLAVCALVLLELAWRSRGFSPMVKDSLALWTKQRVRASNAGKNVVAIIGSSRAQLGLDPQTFSSETGVETVQLAIDGGSPLPVLRDLAFDDQFRGVVICDVTPSSFFVRVSSIERLSSNDWVAGYRQVPLVSSFETTLRVALQERLTILLPQTNLRDQLSMLLAEHKLGTPLLVKLRSDRYQAAHNARGDVARALAHWTERARKSGETLTDSELHDLVTTVVSWVNQIRAHGGDVIFVRLPSSSSVYEAEEQRWPRKQYWDAFMGAFDAKAIQFSDEPELAKFTTAEGSHMDVDQAEGFTRALARVVDKRRWLIR